MSEGKSFEYRGGETERPSEATRQEFFSALEVLGKVLPRSDSPTREYEFENKSIEVGLYDEEELAELEAAYRAEGQELPLGFDCRGFVIIEDRIGKSLIRYQNYSYDRAGVIHHETNEVDSAEQERRIRKAAEAERQGDADAIKRMGDESEREFYSKLNASIEAHAKGLTGVTEAEMREVNDFLKRLIDARQPQRKDIK